MIQIFYCEKRIGDPILVYPKQCGIIATHITTLASKKDKEKLSKSYRCEECKNKGTNNKIAVQYEIFCQKENINKVNKYLTSLVGKTLKKTLQIPGNLKVEYLRGDLGIMCRHQISNKWVFVHYNKIKGIIGNTR